MLSVGLLVGGLCPWHCSVISVYAHGPTLVYLPSLCGTVQIGEGLEGQELVCFLLVDSRRPFCNVASVGHTAAARSVRVLCLIPGRLLLCCDESDRGTHIPETAGRTGGKAGHLAWLDREDDGVKSNNDGHMFPVQILGLRNVEICISWS
jgi:hypothetical protein